MPLSDDDQKRRVRVIGRTVLTVLVLGLCAAGCASAPKNARGEPLTNRVEAVNSCGTNMLMSHWSRHCEIDRGGAVLMIRRQHLYEDAICAG